MPSKKTNNPDKDCHKPQRPPSRSLSRLALKMQKNETQTRLNQDNIPTNRPGSTSTGRSFKDVVLASPKTIPTKPSSAQEGTVRLKLANRSRSPTTRSANARITSGLDFKDDNQEGKWITVTKSPRKSNPTPQKDKKDDQKQRSPMKMDDGRSTTTTSTTRQELADVKLDVNEVKMDVSEAKMDITDIRNDIKDLMGFLRHKLTTNQPVEVEDSEPVNEDSKGDMHKIGNDSDEDEYDDGSDKDEGVDCIDTSSAIQRKLKVKCTTLPSDISIKKEELDERSEMEEKSLDTKMDGILPSAKRQLDHMKMNMGNEACDDECYEAIPVVRNANSKNIPIEYYSKHDREALEHQMRHADKEVKSNRMKYSGGDKFAHQYQKRRQHAKRQIHLKKEPTTEKSRQDDYLSRVEDTKTLFGQNEFSLACNALKIKYSDMSNFLKDKQLEDDLIYQLQKLYDNISRSISFAFQSHIGVMPKFRELEATTSFTELFLGNLLGATMKKCSSIFDRLGEIIKDMLTSTSCINASNCPKAKRIIDTNKIADGWTILEKLIKRRVVFCGAIADVDLDIVLAHLTLNDNESYHKFYERTQALVNQYRLQYRNSNAIPFGKIVLRFTQELMRAPEYIPYLANKYKTIIEQQKEFDKQHGYDIEDYVPYTIENIYETLEDINAPDTPSALNISTIQMHYKSINTTPTSTNHGTTVDSSLRSVIAMYEFEPELQPIIASFQTTPPPEECTTPSICAFRQPRNRCHACLLGFHDEVNCYLRGQAFMPEELKQRINRYNATHGSAPPKDHKFLPYKPSSVTADVRNRRDKDNNNNKKSGQYKKQPFSNNKTKQPTMNVFEVVDEQYENGNNDNSAEEHLTEEEKKAVVSAFVAGQVKDVDDNGDFYITDGDEEDPIICVVESSAQKFETTMDIDEKILMQKNVDFDTPADLLEVIAEFHSRNRNEPNQYFLCQHADKLSRLPQDIYRECGKYEFQVDSGANVGATNNRSLFYFYIPAKVEVEQAGGSVFMSHGWGGILLKIDGKVRLHAPVHYTPNAPRNILSPGAMISYSGFKGSNHKLHQSIDMIDNRGYELTEKLHKRNGLDFVNLQIMSFDHNLYDMKRSVPVMAPAVVYNVQKEKRNEKLNKMVNNTVVTPNTKGEDGCDQHKKTRIKLANGTIKSKTKLEMPRLEREPMSLIAAFYVHLFPATSPRTEAIRTMNTLFGREYNSNIPRSIPNIFSIQHKTNDTIAPIINSKLCRKAARTLSYLQEYILLHLGSMHASDATIRPMIKGKLLEDLPPISQEMDRFNCTCTFCILNKTNKLPRGRLVDHTPMKPFQQLHMDFSFFSHTSIRGMTCALGVICASTSYPFGFPTRNKTPPLDIVRYLIKSIRNMGHEINFIRVDEDGALAKSAEFCRLIVQLECVLQTTSGGNSENNGKIERPHQTQANMVRAALSAMSTIISSDSVIEREVDVKDFWCFAYSHAIHTQRRMYNKGIKDIPYYKVHGKRPSAKELVPFGSIITVVNPSKNTLPKLSTERVKMGYFLGFGNHIRSVLYWDPLQPTTYKRTYHAIIEDTMTLKILQPSFSTPMDSEENSQVLHREFTIAEGPFPKEKINTIKISLPPQGTAIGLNLRDDELYNMPYLWKLEKQSPVVQFIPKALRRNQFIIHIDGNSPITSMFVKDHLENMQSIGMKEVTIDLVHRGSGDTSTPLEMTRAIFDQLPRFQNQRPIINSLNTEIPTSHLHFVRSARKPEVPRFFHECLQSPLRTNWIAAARIAFEKNQRVAVFSLPFDRSILPKEERVFATVLVPEIKQTDIPGVWELRIRECIVGTKQQKKLDYEESYSPTVNDTTVKIQIAFCAALNYTISIVDVKNAFQNTISKKEKRIYVTVPPTYLEWVKDFEDDFQYFKDIQYIRQMLNANQGTRDAGNQWYILLYTVLKEYGMVRSTIDHGFLVRDFESKGKLYVSLATDDLMCGYKYLVVFDDFVQYLRQYFTIVVQLGNVLKFLGIRIIQSPEAISIDQAQYLYSICEHYFGTDPQSVRTVSIPMRSDGEFEKELYESPPLSEKELVEYAIRFKGGFRSHIGKLQFGVITRFDFQFAVQRISEFSCAPTEAAFNAIDRVYRYIAQDILRPTVFPKESMEGNTTLTISLTPDQKDTIVFKHSPTLFTDAELARDLQSRRSYYCVIVTMMGVIVLCKIRKSSSVMLHTTDAEAQASFDGVRRLAPIRNLCGFMGYPIKEPSTHFVDNAAVHQIITSERMTPRCRHFDLPIAFLHEQHGKSYTSQLIKTWLQLSDIGTKPLVRALHKRFKYFGSGERYLPKKDSEHWNNLEMQYYEMKFTDIINSLREVE